MLLPVARPCPATALPHAAAQTPTNDDAAALAALARRSGLGLLHLAGRTLLPVVQGGMGVGVSAGGLAGTVAALGAWGTVASVDLRRLHPDLMARCEPARGPGAAGCIAAANREALDREIRRARALAGGRGLVAVNVMKALSAYAELVQQALTSGADALVVGAGLPLDLPELAREHPQVALVPILSDARGVQLVLRKWERRGRLPDAVVIEHPGLAGGHLGAARVADVNDPRFDFEQVLPAVRALLRDAGAERHIPLIAAGGVQGLADIRRLQALGADAVQLGTAFAVTQESDASHTFKRVLAGAGPQDLVTFTSVAGLPARAVRTPWLSQYLRVEHKLKAVPRSCLMAFDCLAHCGLRDGLAGVGQFCIDRQLGLALAGDQRQGLFFRGAGRLPFGAAIRPVRELMQCLLGGNVPQAVAPSGPPARTGDPAEPGLERCVDDGTAACCR